MIHDVMAYLVILKGSSSLSKVAPKQTQQLVFFLQCSLLNWCHFCLWQFLYVL